MSCDYHKFDGYIRPCGPSRAPMPAGAISGYSIVHDPIPHRNRGHRHRVRTRNVTR